jgi:hypothetical protein
MLERLFLLSYWSLIILVSVIISNRYFPPTALSGMILNLKRKFFHAVAILMFVPAFFVDVRALKSDPPNEKYNSTHR